MIKKLLSLLLLISVISCHHTDEEVKKTVKSRSASERINSSDSNSKEMLKELDE